jgi:soluble lytic murein transglycosylase-like protein
MTYLQIIGVAAKAAKVSAVLLYAICAHESNDFMYDYTMYDAGSPSYSVCQIKESSARQLGFTGEAMELRNPNIGIKYAALYLKYQQQRYGNDWIKLVASYNAGSYIEGKVKGCPRNLKYIRKVQQKLQKDLQRKLSCDIKDSKFIDKLEEE